MSASFHHPERGLADRLTALFWQRPRVLLALLLTPPLFWLGVVYVGSLAALLWQSFYSVDQFSGVVVKEFTLNTYRELLLPQNYDIIVRTVTMAALVTIASVILAFPIAFFAARFAKGRWKAFFYLGIMLPLWSSYLVKVYAWKLILAKEGIITWAANGIGAGSVLDGLLAIPVIGGNSLSTSYIGTFLVFVYVWLPYMILPMQASLERVPTSMLEASADLGASAFQTFRHVIMPNLGTALLAGGMLAFALSFDEVIVTTFTAGQQKTLPIWMLDELVRPRQRPVTNVVAIVVFAATFLPILFAYTLTRGAEETAGGGK